jgi:hypothetical protein
MSDLGAYDYPEALRLFKLFAADAGRDKELFTTYGAGIFADIRQWTKSREISTIIPRHSLVGFFKILFYFLFGCIVSLGSFLLVIIRGSCIAVFTEDKVTKANPYDFRLEPLYRSLRKSGSSYIEIVHTIPGRTMLTHFFKRGRPVIYLETLDLLVLPFVYAAKRRIIKRLSESGSGKYGKREQELFNFLIIKYGSSQSTISLRKWMLGCIFASSSIKKLFSIDDPRHWGVVLAAATKHHVDTWGIQHGHYTKYHIGMLVGGAGSAEIRPKHLLVWSEYWKNELERLGSFYAKSSIIVGGTPRKLTAINHIEDAYTTILIPYETDAPKMQVRQFMEKLSLRTGVKLLFKVRADIDVDSQVREYGFGKILPQIEVILDTAAYLPQVDVVLGTYSTFLYDMVLDEIPVGLLDTPLDYGEGMIINSLAERVTLAHLDADIARIETTSHDTLRSRKARLEGLNPPLLEDTLFAILNDRKQQ